MKRREFITLLGGAAAAWPLAARAQQPTRAADRRAPELQLQMMRKYRPGSERSCRGLHFWAGPIGRNVRIDTRWAAARRGRIRRHAAELVALAPDVILALGARR